MSTNTQLLSDKLQILVKNEGSFTFSIGEYYVQFEKNEGESEIYFEAVSHHLVDAISETVGDDFVRLNFSIDGENYFKTLPESNIRQMVSETEKIFRNIYRVDYEIPFEVTDLVLYADGTDTTVTIVKSKSTGARLFQLLLVFVIVAVALYFVFSK